MNVYLDRNREKEMFTFGGHSEQIALYFLHAISNRNVGKTYKIKIFNIVN
jgi:hypothetical protein